jgi:hypothetical protein
MDGINFKFYLNFKNDSIGRVEISEPVGFDGATFTIEQDSKRYGRDVAYGSEEVSLSFFEGVYDNGLTHCFDLLVRYYSDYGFESEVEFIVNKNGVDFVVGLLDYQLAETDQITHFKTKVIQNTNQAIVKRRDDVNVDVFSSTDLDDNAIRPVTTQKILLKAKPVVQFSKWDSKDIGGTINYVGSGFTHDFTIPIANNLINYKIENSYAPFDVFWSGTDLGITAVRDFIFANRLLTAKTALTNVKVKIKNLNLFGVTSSGSVSLRYGTSFYDDNGNWISAGNTPTTNLETNNFTLSIIDTDYEFEIPYMASGESLWCDTTIFRSSGSFTSVSAQYTRFSHDGVEISVTSTAIDSVIEGVRHINYVKQVFKSATGLNVIAPKYDIGGQFYNNFVFNGKLIRQFTDQAFYGTIKENVSQLVELNSDYQINKDAVYIGQYNDFYTNNEIGAFLTAPEQSFKSAFNDRYSINKMEYKYKSFEQDKDESNTIDAIHTSTQWLLPNKQVENNLKIEVDFVRDPFEIESARRQGIFTKDTTSLSNDDKVYIIDVIELAPNTRNEFTALLQYTKSIEDETFKILSNGSFNWNLLGFEVGNTIIVNGNSYVVAIIENTVITLTDPTADGTTGTAVITVNYPLTNVSLVNRTNQEFNLIENIATGENFSNLQYSIGRNLQHWYSYLKTACKFRQLGKIKNTYFKSNGLAKTQFRSGAIITENADILVSNLGDAILSPYVYTTKLVADYNDVLNVLELMETINLDNSIGGFIRVMDNEFRMAKIYPTKLSYKWATAELDITGEVKQDSEYLEINSTLSGLIIIDEVGYDTDIIKPLSLRTEGDYIQILDKRGIALNNLIKFDKVRVNSNIFSNIVELSDELLTL